MRRSLIFLGAAAVTSALFINFCATVFQCGCLSLWAGADSACNIHRAGVPHCPWCDRNPYVPYFAIVALQAAASFWPGPISRTRRLALALALFPLSGTALAVLYGTATGYWKS